MTTVLVERVAPNPVQSRPRVTILDPGPSTTVQDLGRPGFAHLGVTTSGGADRSSLTLANRLVGNDVGLPVLETTLGGLVLTLSENRIVAVTGAPVDLRVDGRPVAESRILLPAGRRLTLGRPKWGLRSYVAIAGGVDADQVMGSASTDCLSGLGPDRLRAGDKLALGDRVGALPDVPVELATVALPHGIVDVRFRWGPRDGLFTPADRAALTARTWTVSTECDRVGVRLTGTSLDIGTVDLASEGMALGAIQVPPSGQPIVFLADHPVTGGYPVIGVVTERDVDLLAQAAPGTRVRFSPLPPGGP